MSQNVQGVERNSWRIVGGQEEELAAGDSDDGGGKARSAFPFPLLSTGAAEVVAWGSCRVCRALAKVPPIRMPSPRPPPQAQLFILGFSPFPVSPFISGCKVTRL